MYKALYRKWRPLTFSEVIGQQHITKTLKNQVSTGRLSHAYLFTGTRGTGKTSCAKILSRAVNCENPRDGDPCNECKSCRGILDGSILDVIEMDAASNNGVDDIRLIRDEVVYTPVDVKKRVYIIDEVHMLSTQAFNALLKTLEEPPEHLLFILATTEIHKVPATILSRCQTFAFKRIKDEDIAASLIRISEKEKIRLEPKAAALIARMSDGAMRDALSILDQCASMDGEVTYDRVLDTLGMAGSEKIRLLAGAIGKRDIRASIELFGDLYEEGRDVAALFDELCVIFSNAVRAKALPDKYGDDLSGEAEIYKLFDISRLVYTIETLENTVGKLRNSKNRRLDAEVCLLRLCDESLLPDLSSLEARVAAFEAGQAIKKDVVMPNDNTEHSHAAVQKITPTVSNEQQSIKLSKNVVLSDIKASSERNDANEVKERNAADTVNSASEALFWPDLLAALKPEISQAHFTNLELCKAYVSKDMLIVSPDAMGFDLLKGKGLEEKIEALTERFAGKRMNVIISVEIPKDVEQEPDKDKDKLDGLIERGNELNILTIKE